MNTTLLFCPVYEMRPGVWIEPRTQQCIEAIAACGGVDVVYQDDNPHTHTDKTVRGIYNHLHQFQVARRRFLAGTWTWLLVIEHDMIVPAGILEMLQACDADIAYAPYMWRHGRPQLNLFHRWDRQARNPGPPLDQRRREYRAALRMKPKDGYRIVDVSGAGFGCILVRRRVIEAIDYRLGPQNVHCDTWWTRDVYRAGFSQRANLDAICGHICPDGAVLWPSYAPADYPLRAQYGGGPEPQPEYPAPSVARSVARWWHTESDMKVKSLISFVARHGGQIFKIQKGEIFDMPRGTDWLRAGFVEPVKQKREKAIKPPTENAINDYD